METEKTIPTKYSFALNEKDIRYGIIRISNHKEWFTANSNITIICKDENGVDKEYRKRIPSGGYYISGLTRQHSNNNATPGTIVEISKTANGYYLEYTLEKKKDNNLTDLIDSLKSIVKEYSWAFYKNETNVRTEIIDPILSMLDWQFPKNFYRELVCYSGGNVDYALHNGNRFCILVEAKSIDTDLDNVTQQVINYINDERFNECIGIVTNGVTWKVINNDERNNEFITIDLYNDNFIEFIKIFHNSNFDIEIVRDKLRALDRNRSQKPSFEEFDIIDEGEKIPGKNQTEKFVNFIAKHKGEVLDLEEKKCFNVTVISPNLKDFRESTRNQCKENAVKLNNIKYYITRDHSTTQKRMIAQQIICLLNLENASIEDCQ